jgi:hypothetical protein
VLAYLFWHRPLESSDPTAYEESVLTFHRSLARSRPVGLCGSAAFRVAELPWRIAPERAAQPAAGSAAAYEDWYLVEDFAALGVLNEAAVGRGHRSAHDDAARRLGAGAGGLYALIEGDRSEAGQGSGIDSIAEATLATWVARPPGSKQRMLGELLGDGMDPRHASLWRRQLVLGPAPEFCLVSSDPPQGVAPTRLPEGWTAAILDRRLLWSG